MAHSSTELHGNPSCSICVILPINKQTKGQGWKHNLRGRDTNHLLKAWLLLSCSSDTRVVVQVLKDNNPNFLVNGKYTHSSWYSRSTHLNQMSELGANKHKNTRARKALTIHQRRKYLSSHSHSSSSGAKNSRHRPAHSNTPSTCVHNRKSHGAEETSNYL